MKRNAIFIFYLVMALMPCIGSVVRSNIGGRGAIIIGNDVNPPLQEGVVAVEYIEVTGTQWIDVGLALQSECGTILDAAYTGYTAGYCRLFGTQKSGAAGGKSCTIRTDGINSGDIRMEIYPAWKTIPFDTDRHLFFMNYPEYTYWIDSLMSFVNSQYPMAVDTSCYLFGNNGATGGAGGHAAARFYRLSCINLSSGTLVRDLIPVRFENTNGESEGGVYDLVTCELYANSGSGKLLIGPDL